MGLREAVAAVVESHIIGVLPHVVHQDVDVVKIDVVVFDEVLPLQDPVPVMHHELIRKTLAVKGKAPGRGVVQHGDVFRLGPALGVADDAHRVPGKPQPLIGGLVPFQGVDLLQRIDLVGAHEVVHPLVMARSPEGHHRLPLRRVQQHGGKAPASAVGLVHMGLQDPGPQDVLLPVQGHQDVPPVQAVHQHRVVLPVLDPAPVDFSKEFPHGFPFRALQAPEGFLVRQIGQQLDQQELVHPVQHLLLLLSPLQSPRSAPGRPASGSRFPSGCSGPDGC